MLKLINYANAQSYDGYCGGMMCGYGYGAWGAGSIITMILFWILIIILIVLVVRQFKRMPFEYRGMHGRGHEDALRILNERFAKGEINKEEYEEKRKILEKDKNY